MDLQMIKKFSEKRAGGLKKLAIDIGMSEQNLHRCINNNRIQAADLEKISLLLHVNIGVFFGEEPQQEANNSGSTDDEIRATAALEEKISLLQQLLQEKERTIQILMKK